MPAQRAEKPVPVLQWETAVTHSSGIICASYWTSDLTLYDCACVIVSITPPLRYAVITGYHTSDRQTKLFESYDEARAFALDWMQKQTPEF